MVKAVTMKDLKPNPKNPRKVSEHKLVQLKKTLDEFGDLGGIVFNRQTKTLVSGHQRVKSFGSNAVVMLEKEYKKPTRTGTVGEGFILFDGERYRYREVSWDDATQKAATIAANKSAGEWDLPLLASYFDDLEDFGVDLDLTGFDELELKGIRKETTTVSQHERTVKEAEGAKEFSADEFDTFKHVCPRCSFEFDKPLEVKADA